MAIYHLHAQVISRGDGRSPVAAAAYRHRSEMTLSNDSDHRSFDYSAMREDLVHEELALPDQTPQWLRSLIDGHSVAGASETLWNAVEIHEVRANAQLAREMVFALPEELTREQNIALVRDYVRDAFSAKGMVADWVYHDKKGNPHVHVMLTMSPLTQEGFGSRWTPQLDADGQQVRKGGKIQYVQWAGDRAMLQSWRSLWAEKANRHLALQGHDMRIDHRSFEEQGIALEPTTKIGVTTKNIGREAENKGEVVDLERLRIFEESRQENRVRINRRPEIVLDALSREKSVFDERDVAKYLHRYIDDVVEFQNIMARILTSPDIVKLAAESLDPTTGEIVPMRFATREMIRIEAEMARRAEHLVSGSHRVRHGVKAEMRDAVLATHERLSDEQRIAIERISGSERMAAVVGRAGAGKTTMMKAAREVWEKGGYRVVGGALAGKAAEGLEKEAGIPSRTLASWQLSWGRGHDMPDEKTIFVIDEAGMVASRQMADFVEVVARSGGKLVLVGDADQLQPIEAGAAFRSLTDRVGYAELGTIYRQREQWMRDASMNLARGNVEQVIHAYQNHHRIIRSTLKDQAIVRLIEDWNRDYDPGKSSLILAHLRRDVHRLNRLARGKLIERGVLEQGFAFRTAEGERHFAVGDQIVFLKNDRDLGVKNGMLARIVEAGEGRIVAEIGDPGSEQMRRVDIDQRAYRNVDHGYATTIHKSQGATVDRVKVLATLSLDRHLTYVAMTRHREDVMLYHGGLSFEMNGGLIANLSKKGAKETTLDFAGSALYRPALAYANHRGLYGLRVAKAMLDNHRRWVAEQKVKLEAIGAKLAGFARKFGLVGTKNLAHDAKTDTQTIAHTPPDRPNAYVIPSMPLFRGIATWPVSIKQHVEEKLQSDSVLTAQWAELSQRLVMIYQAPDDAVKAMKLETTLKPEGATDRTALDQLSAHIATTPERFGALRGKTGLLASKGQKEDRKLAMANARQLARDVKDYVRLRSENSHLRTVELERERDHAHVDIPALSPAAESVLARIRDAIDRNDLNAALSYALADKMVDKELAEVATTLDKRFGARSFLGSKTPNEAAFNKAATQVSPADRTKLADVWPQLNAIQKLAAHKRTQEMNKARALKQAQAKDEGITR